MNWILFDNGFSDENIDYFGNKYLTGNGYMGVRGSLEEYTADQRPAINLAGVYDQVPGKWRESVNAPNGLYVAVEVDGEAYGLPTRLPAEHRQWLDLHHALHGRRTVWPLASGSLTVESERFASMAEVNHLYLRYRLTASETTVVTLYGGIDTAIWDINGPHFSSVTMEEKQGILRVDGITVEQGFHVTVEEAETTDIPTAPVILQRDGRLLRAYTFTAEGGKTYTVDKTVLVHTAKDEPKALSSLTYEEAKAAHAAAWDAIWSMSEVTIEGDEQAELALNYSLYHLNCIAPRHSDSMSIPARGLSGQVYKGAVFWDTEMFMFDYFLFTDPKVAKTFIKYRIDTLPGAMAKAASYGYDGAFYAWESHEGGIDACTDYNITDVFTGRPSRTYFRDKQVHNSAAMVYALVRYLTVTGDTSVLKEGGEELLLQCARFYYSLLLKRANKDRYEIHDVVGPDEYHERVNNNAYTNRMAKFALEKAAELLQSSAVTDGEELDRFADAAARLFVPMPDPVSGLIEQFDGYFALEDASVEEVRSRLLDPKEYWGGANGVAAHTQVNKQADVAAMLGMFPEEYDRAVLEKNFFYYEPRTEHGSSLSACMFSLLACYIGRPDHAYPLFMKSAEQDLKKASKLWLGLIFIGGTHPAASGGAWMVASRGFAGVSVVDGRPVAGQPQLPTGWKSLRYRMLCGGKAYTVTATREKTEIRED